MRRYAIDLSAALVSFLVGIMSANLLPTSSFGTLSYAESEREVLEVEREYIRAHLERDVPALDRVLADDFTSFRGRVRKEHRLALLANPLFSVTSLSTEGVSVRVRGDEAWVRGNGADGGECPGARVRHAALQVQPQVREPGRQVATRFLQILLSRVEWSPVEGA